MKRVDFRSRALSADQLNAALHEVGGSAQTDYLTDIVAQAGRTRQRPAWTLPERWLPMTIALRPAAVPRAFVYLALLATLLALLAFTSLFFGASPSIPPTVPRVHNGLIAFDANGDIDVAGPDGSGQRALISGPGTQYGPNWSPDGSRLAYKSDTYGSGWQLIVVNADGTHPVTVASGTLELTGAPGPAWSPDGTTIAYSARTGLTGTCPGGYSDGDFCTSRIFLAAADGSGSHQIGDPTLDARSPAWSPDGSTIAFGGGNAGQGVHLYLMDASGANVRQLSDVTGRVYAFIRNSWSPDGTMVAGQASAADGSPDPWDTWIIPVDGSAPTAVGIHDADADEILPSWAPDRDALAWTSNGHTVLMEVGAAPVDLAPPGGMPFWSPDGTLLATTNAGMLTVLGLAGDVRTTVPGASDWVSWQPVFGAS
jgi:dipeptidyl aminopeptidase/acylaminoacyl peptidase